MQRAKAILSLKERMDRYNRACTFRNYIYTYMICMVETMIYQDVVLVIWSSKMGEARPCGST